MDSLRLVPAATRSGPLPCCRCGQDHAPWDLIAGKAYCPACEELLAQGEAPPLQEPTVRHVCAACPKVGTVSYVTCTLRGRGVVEMELCGEHLRALLGRRLGPSAYYQLRRRLQVVGVRVEEVFLLHEEFYDANGRALQPAVELE